MVKRYSIVGEKATWKSIANLTIDIAILRNHMMIEQCIQQNINSLRERIILNAEKVSPVKELNPPHLDFQSLIIPLRPSEYEKEKSPSNRKPQILTPAFVCGSPQTLSASAHFKMEEIESLPPSELSNSPVNTTFEYIVTRNAKSAGNFRIAKSQSVDTRDLRELNMQKQPKKPLFSLDFTYTDSSDDED
jgi:hypothetical protein